MKRPKGLKPTTPRTAQVVNSLRNGLRAYFCSNCGCRLTEHDAYEDMCPECLTVFDGWIQLKEKRKTNVD